MTSIFNIKVCLLNVAYFFFKAYSLLIGLISFHHIAFNNQAL